MSDTVGKIHIGINAESVYTSPELDAFKQVALNDGGETIFYPDSDVGGRLLEADCPGATLEMAKNIYNLVNGYQYQPIEFTRAVYNPAMEMGDAVESMAKRGGVYRYDITFGDLTTADISAPADEDFQHEYSSLPDSNSKYATYKALLAGRAAINGACIQDDTLDGSAIVSGSIGGGSGGMQEAGWLSKIMSGSIATTDTDTDINDDLGNARTAIANINAWINGTGATFNWIATSGISMGYSTFLNNRRLYIGSDSRVYAAAEQG